jgi:SSS family transporter
VGELSAIDLAVLAATLLIAAGAGLLLGRRAGSAKAYLAGERDLPWGALLLSIVATETSSVTFLSVPGEAWAGDLRFLQLPLGYVLGRIAVARWLLPLYFAGDALTAYEVLGRRFGSGVKQATSALFLVMRTLGDGVRLWLTAVPLQLLSGWSLPTSIAVMAGVTVAYCWFGGVRAVVWTDVVQFVIYVAGGVLALWVAAGDVGWGEVFSRAAAAGKLRVVDLGISPLSALTDANLLLAGLIGGAFLTLATHGTDQLMVQRYLAARSLGDARRAVVASGFVVLAQFALFLVLGLALHAWLLHHPADRELKSDQVFPWFIQHRLAELPGAVGLLLGAVFAVSMSTLSSSLSASASTLVNDWLRPVSGTRSSDPPAKGTLHEGRADLRVARVATLAFALLQAGVALLADRLESNALRTVLQIASFTSGLVLGLFFLARACGPLPAGQSPPANERRAALLAFFIALAAMTAIWNWTPIAWPWYALLGAGITVGVGWAARGFVARS